MGWLGSQVLASSQRFVLIQPWAKPLGLSPPNVKVLCFICLLLVSCSGDHQGDPEASYIIAALITEVSPVGFVACIEGGDMMAVDYAIGEDPHFDEHHIDEHARLGLPVEVGFNDRHTAVSVTDALARPEGCDFE